jgi:ferredoxin/flavodoxin
MNIEAVKLVYFSPTRTTQNTLAAVAKGIGAARVEHCDLTRPEAASRGITVEDGELLLVGTPVYGGRVPLIAVRRLERLKGKGVPAVVVVVYGNRAYEDALLELKDLVTDAGCVPVAGAAYVGEHSLASAATPIACGRPDAGDLARAQAFGKAIREKMRGISRLGDMPPLSVPGNVPHVERGATPPVSPVTFKDRCVSCGTCVALCPTGAITIEDVAVSDPGLCMRCCACVKGCPQGARAIEAPLLKERAEKLSMSCRDRKEPEEYMG